MVICVTLNPSIDRTVSIPAFVYGGLNRISSRRIDYSGKGINVAYVHSAINDVPGEGTFCTGFNARDDGKLLEASLDRFGIEYSFVYFDGGLRVNTKVYDEDKHKTTELNERGTELTADYEEAFLDKLSGILHKGDICHLAGSVPPGISKDIYARAIRLVHEKGAICVLDADGELFRRGMEEQPDIIKPNAFELSQYFGREVKTFEELKTAGTELCARGIRYVFITLGGEGSLLCTADGCLFAPALDVPVLGTAGAGDSFIAGAIYAISKGCKDAEVLASAVAAANGSVRREGTLLCRREDYDELLPLAAVSNL